MQPFQGNSPYMQLGHEVSMHGTQSMQAALRRISAFDWKNQIVALLSREDGPDMVKAPKFGICFGQSTTCFWLHVACL
jgi:hypothetical protein